MTLSYRCSNCGTELATTNADPLNNTIEQLRDALRIGLELGESGGHGTGANCPTCHFVREARKALGLGVPKIRPVPGH